MGRIEQELRQLEEFMKAVIEKAPAMLEQMKRIADVARSVSFVDEGEDRSYPHCDELECKERDGSSVYCKHQECDTRRIFVSYEDSIREDPKPSPPEPEMWERGTGINGGFTVCDAKGYVRAKADRGKPSQITLMAAAPQMRDALRMVRDKSYRKQSQRGGQITDRIIVELNPDQWRIIDVALEKAGEQLSTGE